MLLNPIQENPVHFEGREIKITDKASNALYQLCKTPITASTIGMYLNAYSDGKMKKALKTLSNEDISNIVEEYAKAEYTLLCGKEAWDEIPE